MIEVGLVLNFSSKNYYEKKSPEIFVFFSLLALNKGLQTLRISKYHQLAPENVKMQEGFLD